MCCPSQMQPDGPCARPAISANYATDATGPAKSRPACQVSGRGSGLAPFEGDSVPTLVVSRRPRHAGAHWADARSWFGGHPRLGSHAWPRSKSGKPMTFVAQIDLSELAARAGGTSLPTQGALAFFIDGVGERDEG